MAEFCPEELALQCWAAGLPILLYFLVERKAQIGINNEQDYLMCFFPYLSPVHPFPPLSPSLSWTIFVPGYKILLSACMRRWWMRRTGAESDSFLCCVNWYHDLCMFSTLHVLMHMPRLFLSRCSGATLSVCHIFPDAVVAPEACGVPHETQRNWIKIDSW